MRQLLTLIVILFFASSCETATFVDYYIDNQSDSAITVKGTNIIASSEINMTINSNEREDIATWSKLGKETDYFEPTSMFGNDMVITNAVGDTLTKDYKVLSNWASNVDDQRTSASHEYVLVITDSDF